jgi:hypothetical protein
MKEAMVFVPSSLLGWR